MSNKRQKIMKNTSLLAIHLYTCLKKARPYFGAADNALWDMRTKYFLGRGRRCKFLKNL